MPARGGSAPPERVHPAGRRGAHLRVASRNGRVVIATPTPLQEPPGLTGWDIRFLYSLASWPLALRPDQRECLRWIARRARAA